MYIQTQETEAKKIVLNAIESLINEKKQRVVYKNKQHLKSIIYTILSVTGVDIRARSNKREVADAVKIYSHMAREYTDNSFHEIGKSINRNHSTICHSLKNYNSLYRYDDAFRLLADQCISKHFAENGQDQPKDIELESINTLLLKCNYYLLSKIKNYIKRQIDNNG
jgi:chromosomal replication initiation ATPase DnaA